MKITVIRAFNDLTVPLDQERRREIGAVVDVSDERADQLVRLGFAVEGDAPPAAPAGDPQPAANAAPLSPPLADDHPAGPDHQ